MIEHAPGHLASLWYYLSELVANWEFKAAIAAAAAFFGSEPSLFCWLIGMLFADLFFGLAEAFKRRRFSCRKLGRGAMKIPSYCLCIFLIGAVDNTLATAIGINTPLLELFVSYLVATDAVSVMGHMIRLGMPVPKRLRTFILHAQTRIDRELDKISESETNN